MRRANLIRRAKYLRKIGRWWKKRLFSRPRRTGCNRGHLSSSLIKKRAKDFFLRPGTNARFWIARIFVVFTAKTKITSEDIDRHVARTAELRGGTVEALKRFRDAVAGDLVTGPRAAEAHEWAARQAYIALGNFLTSAALLGIDTCPMEGFKPDEYDQILELPGKRLASVVCCAAGYRSAEDKSAGQKKVRFARADVIHIA